MKHTLSLLVITLLLGAGALWFTSCASNEVKGPETPVTALKSEPASATDSNELAPALLTAHLEAHQYAAKPLTASHSVITPVSMAVQPIPAVAAVIAVPVVADSIWDNRWLPWLLLLIALLVLLKAMKNLRDPYRKKAEIAPAAALARKKRWNPVMAFSKSNEKEIAVTAFFKDKEHKMHFSPATTVKKVTAWAAYQCEIFDQSTTEVYLAIRGYSAPLTGTAHIGRFAEHNKHHLKLDVLTFRKNLALAPEAALAQNPELAADEIWVEGAGMTEAVKVSVKPDTPLKEVIGSVARIGKFPPQNAFIFLENESKPLNPDLPLDAAHPRHIVHHVHTQMEIAVTAFFNGQEHKMHFSPATTIKKVAAWASYQYGIFDQDATEVYLAIHGYSAPLTGAAHIGRFVEHDKNNLDLDVMTFTKVNV